MVRSIQVFRYEYPSESNEIVETLKNKGQITYKTRDKNNPDTETEISCDISHVEKINGQGVFGHFVFRKQEILSKNIDKEEYRIVPYPYTFLISPDNRVVVVHGAKVHNTKIRTLLSQTLHDDEPNEFNYLYIGKDKMLTLMETVRKSHTHNILEKPRFRFLEKSWKFHTFHDFSMMNDRCATEDSEFEKMFESCTYFEPQLKILTCKGLMQDTLNKPVTLNMKNDASFSMSVDASPQAWNSFVFKVCKPILG